MLEPYTPPPVAWVEPVGCANVFLELVFTSSMEEAWKGVAGATPNSDL